jgi:hypothetical protein
MIHSDTYKYLWEHTTEQGGPVFVFPGADTYQAVVNSGCLELRFNVRTNHGGVLHHFTVDDVAPPGADSPVVYFNKTDLVYESTIPDFSCSHLEGNRLLSDLFGYSRFLAKALSEGDVLDGTFIHDPDYTYLDSGYDEEVALELSRMVKDILGKIAIFDCACAVIAKEALGNLSDSFRNN